MNGYSALLSTLYIASATCDAWERLVQDGKTIRLLGSIWLRVANSPLATARTRCRELHVAENAFPMPPDKRCDAQQNSAPSNKNIKKPETTYRAFYTTSSTGTDSTYFTPLLLSKPLPIVLELVTATTPELPITAYVSPVTQVSTLYILSRT